MIKEKSWYAVYMRQKAEKKVMELLGRKRVEYYYPECFRTQLRKAKQSNNQDQPTFASILFVYLSPEQVTAIRQVDGISSVLFWLNKPVTLKTEDIKAIQHFHQNHDGIELEKIQIRMTPSCQQQRYMGYEGGTENFEYRLDIPAIGCALVSRIAEPANELRSVA
jgi:transcription antitermination factor NusG